MAFESSLGNLAVLLVIAIRVVYIVLGILYESYIHPLTILSGLPSAAFGALVTLIVFRMDLNIYAFVGMIMLIGIVEKNAIMQIDFALEAERGGKKAEEAIYEGCLIRFRPIMMTTMAALLGALPIAVGYGAGGEARQPLGLVVVGGLLFSQLVTLFLTPVVYTYMAQLQSWMKSRQQARTNFSHVLAEFQTARKPGPTSAPTCETGQALGGDAPPQPTITEYTLIDADVKGPFEKQIPRRLADQAKLDSLGYQSATELIA